MKWSIFLISCHMRWLQLYGMCPDEELSLCASVWKRAKALLSLLTAAEVLIMEEQHWCMMGKCVCRYQCVFCVWGISLQCLTSFTCCLLLFLIWRCFHWAGEIQLTALSDMTLTLLVPKRDDKPATTGRYSAEDDQIFTTTSERNRKPL